MLPLSRYVFIQHACASKDPQPLRGLPAPRGRYAQGLGTRSAIQTLSTIKLSRNKQQTTKLTKTTNQLVLNTRRGLVFRRLREGLRGVWEHHRGAPAQADSSEGGMIWLETLIELKLLTSSCSSSSSVWS